MTATGATVPSAAGGIAAPAASACRAVARRVEAEADLAARELERLPGGLDHDGLAVGGPERVLEPQPRLGDGQAADVDAGHEHGGADARRRGILGGGGGRRERPDQDGEQERASHASSVERAPRGPRKRAATGGPARVTRRAAPAARAAPAVPLRPVPPADDDASFRQLPPGLWDRLRLDPVRAPEHIALSAARTFAPQAAAWADEKRRRYAVAPAELAQMAKRRHATLARFEGAATGVGGFVTIAPDLVALAWIQSRLVFYIAAAYGYDPHDRMRPAEALVIFDFYSDPRVARRALDGIGKTVVESYVGSKLAAGGGPRRSAWRGWWACGRSATWPGA